MCLLKLCIHVLASVRRYVVSTGTHSDGQGAPAASGHICEDHFLLYCKFKSIEPHDIAYMNLTGGFSLESEQRILSVSVFLVKKYICKFGLLCCKVA